MTVRISLCVALCAAAPLLMSEGPVASAATRFGPALRFPVTDGREELTYALGRDLMLKVTRGVDAQGRHFGWDLSVVDRRLRSSPNFFYACLCGHGPLPQDLYAWHVKTGYFPNERILPVWGYPYEVRVICEGCTATGGEYTAARFENGTVDIGWRRLTTSNPRQRRLSDLIRRSGRN